MRFAKSSASAAIGLPLPPSGAPRDRGQGGRWRIPLALPAKDMQGIGRRDPADMREASGCEPVERGFLRGGGQKLGQRLGLIRDPGVKGCLLRREPGGHRIGQTGANREQALVALRVNRADLLFECRNDDVGKAAAR